MQDNTTLNPQQKANLIGAELQKAQQTAANIPTSIGMLSIKSANRTLLEASMLKNPKQLYGEFWFEHEIGCLFADSNVGKSILAVQIAEDIAKTGETVLYFDFELSEKQFQLRFTDDDGTLHQFPPTFLRVHADMNLIADLDVPFEDKLMKDIEQAAIETKAKVLIIDNISILCMQTEKGEDAATLVQRLRSLKNQHGFSILIIAHTPKRIMSMPITQNDLAGSKKLFNFIDSCFAIGQSAKGGNIRYVKQVKVRNCEMKYGSDNVMVCHIEKENAMVKFVSYGTAPEHEHLRMVNRDEQMAEVLQLSESGMSIREIADKTGVSKSAVGRMLQKASTVPNGQTGQAGQVGHEYEVSQSSQLSHHPSGTVVDNDFETDNDEGDDTPF